MIRQSEWTLTCDHCARHLRHRGSPDSKVAMCWELLKRAVAIGWHRFGEKDYCPPCWQARQRAALTKGEA